MCVLRCIPHPLTTRTIMALSGLKLHDELKEAILAFKQVCEV
jgi:hypothetical protein